MALSAGILPAKHYRLLTDSQYALVLRESTWREVLDTSQPGPSDVQIFGFLGNDGQAYVVGFRGDSDLYLTVEEVSKMVDMAGNIILQGGPRNFDIGGYTAVVHIHLRP